MGQQNNVVDEIKKNCLTKNNKIIVLQQQILGSGGK